MWLNFRIMLRNLQNIDVNEQIPSVIIADQAQIAMFLRQKTERQRCKAGILLSVNSGEIGKRHIECLYINKAMRNKQS